MEQNVRNFLESGLLDKYIIGATSVSETAKVEQFITDYPEVKDEYDMLQDQLALAAQTNAKVAPAHILGSIFETLDQPVVKLKYNKKPFPWTTIAASFIAFLFAGASYVFYNQNQNLMNENNIIADEIFDLRKDIQNNNNKLDGVMRQFMKLNNPETQKYVLRGNERAKDLKTVAYINPIEKSSLIDIVALPELSDQQCYQMWAQLQDGMVNLGILDMADRKLKSVPYIENALSLSITIEPKGGNNNASLDNAVAEIPITSNN